MLRKFLFSYVVSIVFFSLVGASAGANESFPRNPNLALTPGSLCQEGAAYRYPERVRYCARDVDPSLKWEIIREYDQQLGFRVQTMPRRDFKIDHFIPLCVGGSNHEDNLWPQHKSVYVITDELEQRVCEKMAMGHLSQHDAIGFIREAKTDLSKAPAILQHVHSL